MGGEHDPGVLWIDFDVKNRRIWSRMGHNEASFREFIFLAKEKKHEQRERERERGLVFFKTIYIDLQFRVVQKPIKIKTSVPTFGRFLQFIGSEKQ